MPAPKGHAPYPGCEKGGRPIKYTPEFIDREAEALDEWRKDKDSLFIEDFCLERGYLAEQVALFEKQNDKFSVAYKKFKMKQKSVLFKGGLSKKFAYPMCALILSHAHDINAKTEQKLSGDAINPLAFALTTVNGQTKDLVQ